MRRLRLNVLLQITLFVLFSFAAQGQWQQMPGLTGGSVYEIVSTPGFIFVNGGPAGIFRSADNGMMWSRANNGLPDYPHCNALASNGTTLYAAIYYNGIYSSTDNGLTWVPIKTGIETKNFNTVFVDGQNIYVASDGLYYSPDGGVSWIQRNKFFNAGSSIKKFLKYGGKLYALVGSYSSMYSIYVSENKGETWVWASIPNAANVTEIAAFDNTMYIFGVLGNQISRDYGVTWSNSDFGINYHYFNGIRAFDDKVYIAEANSTIYYSENEGVTFSTITTLPYTGSVNDITIINNTLWISGAEGLFASADGATTWSERNNQLTNHIIKSVILDDPFIYVGTFQQGVFVSSDNGKSWNKRNEGLRYSGANRPGVVGMHLDDNDLIIGTIEGIYKSTDHGATWDRKLSVNSQFWTLIGEGKKAFTATKTSQYYSSNDGEDWVSRNDPLFADRIIGGGFIKGDTIVLFTAYDQFNRILVSKDFGISWQSFSLGVNLAPNQLIYVDSKLFLSTWTGLLVSADFGKTWTKKSNGLPAEKVTGLTNWNNDIYAGTSKGVHVSYDGGDNWRPVGEVFVYCDASPLVFSDSFLFSGTYGNSLWSLPLDKVNVPPVLTGVVADLTFVPGQPFTLAMDDLVITDPDTNSENISVTILSGTNYTVTGNTITPAPGFYGELSIKVMLTDGYTSKVSEVRIGGVVGVEEDLQMAQAIYPNPATDKIAVQVSSQNASFNVKDCLGRTVLENIELIDGQINVSHLSPGIYYLVAYPQQKVFRFVKKQ